MGIFLPLCHGSFAMILVLQMRRQRLGGEVAWQWQTAWVGQCSVVPTLPDRGPTELWPKTLCFEATLEKEFWTWGFQGQHLRFLATSMPLAWVTSDL